MPAQYDPAAIVSVSLTVGSLFSGIGGFDLGFERAGFDVRWQVEIEADAVAVLSRHWPAVRRYRDIEAVTRGRHRNRTAHGLMLPPVDVIVGGFPCQDLSVAGKREGLSGSRSGLFFAFMRAVRIMRHRHQKPDVLVLENVPGLLSSQCGRDFHTVLSEVADGGFRRAYRILDSQYFGVPQRRRRVFIVGCARNTGRDPFPLLFESARGDGDSAARGETRPRIASTLRGRSARAGVNAPGRGGEDDSNLVTFGWNKSASQGMRVDTQTTEALQSSNSSNPAVAALTRNGVGTCGADDNQAQAGHLVAVGVHANQRGECRTSELAGSLSSSRSGKQYEGVMVGENERNTSQGPANLIASPITASAGHHGHSSPRGDGRDNLQIAYALRRDPGGIGQAHNTTFPNGVRRLTPLECERLQGFPDGWTCLCGEGHRGSAFCTCPDTPRYKGLGNAVTVPVIEWIARRLHASRKGVTA